MEYLKQLLKMSNNFSLIEIETLTTNNVLAVTQLSIELWPDADFDEELLSWEKIVNTANNYCALAKLSNAYIGFIHLSIRNDYVEGAMYDSIAYLEGIYVKKAFRNNGVGKMLLSNGIAWAKSKGAKQLGSDSTLDNFDSLSFHEKVGFVEVNRIVCFIQNI